MDTQENTKYQLLGPSSGQESENLLEGCADEEAAIQRLQALLSEWLRMENLVVLTGAGCSVSCGGKTMLSLEKAVLNAVKNVSNMTQGTIQIMNERLKDDEKDEKAEWAKTGFEQWLSYLVNSVYLAEEQSSPIDFLRWKGVNSRVEHIKRLITYVSKAIYAECALTLPEDKKFDSGKQDIAPHLSFLSKLMARDSNLGRTHLFTLNYDTLFEQAIELLGIQYFDGFTGRANAHFDPSVYGLDIYYPGELSEGRVRRFDKFLHFYKLHGSIHWRSKDNEIFAQHGNLEKYASYQGENLDKAKLLKKRDFAPDYKDFGILPTSNKFVQTLDMPYSHLFRAFQARLSAPQTFLMVLGYGFGDEHVNRIIETALMNPALIMLVVEPNPKSKIVKQISRYKELGKRVFIFTVSEDSIKKDKFGNVIYEYATFDHFVKEVLPDVQWLDDWVNLRSLEKRLQRLSPQQSFPASGEDNGEG